MKIFREQKFEEITKTSQVQQSVVSPICGKQDCGVWTSNNYSTLLSCVIWQMYHIDIFHFIFNLTWLKIHPYVFALCFRITASVTQVMCNMSFMTLDIIFFIQINKNLHFWHFSFFVALRLLKALAIFFLWISSCYSEL